MPSDTAGQTERLGWHLITCEYPPQRGGVSDYSYLVAAGLNAAGDQVDVWCPSSPGTHAQSERFRVHRDLGSMAPKDLRRVGEQLEEFPAPRRILVQWVPHGYGYRSMNFAFCWWLRNRARRHGDQVELMVHEPYLSFRWGSMRQNAAAVVHRLMVTVLLSAMERVWVSIPSWEKRLKPYALGRKIPFLWLPIPANIPVADNPAGVRAVRDRYAAGDSFLLGHFGTYGSPIADLLEAILLRLESSPPGQRVLLMGARSNEFREQVIRRRPQLAPLIQATGALEPENLSCHLAACDLLIQPYPDGVSTRRGSFLAGLSHGVPTITTIGEHTEPLWKDSDALRMAPAGDLDAFITLIGQLRGDERERARMGQAARKLYRERFDVAHTVAALRRAALVEAQPVCAS